jgi:hypothetical protein
VGIYCAYVEEELPIVVVVVSNVVSGKSKVQWEKGQDLWNDELIKSLTLKMHETVTSIISLQ